MHPLHHPSLTCILSSSHQRQGSGHLLHPHSSTFHHFYPLPPASSVPNTSHHPLYHTHEPLANLTHTPSIFNHPPLLPHQHLVLFTPYYHYTTTPTTLQLFPIIPSTPIHFVPLPSPFPYSLSTPSHLPMILFSAIHPFTFHPHRSSFPFQRLSFHHPFRHPQIVITNSWHIHRSGRLSASFRMQISPDVPRRYLRD